MNVAEQPEKEKEMMELTGARIVPTFLFKKKGFLSRKQTKIFIDFEQNEKEIKRVVKGDT